MGAFGLLILYFCVGCIINIRQSDDIFLLYSFGCPDRLFDIDVVSEAGQQKNDA